MIHERTQQLLHDAADEIAVGVPPTSDMIRAGRRAKRGRRVKGAIGASAAVALVSVAGTVLLDTSPADDHSDPASPTTAAPSPVTPPGTRLVGARGIAIAVPADWGTNEVQCIDTPTADTVIFGQPNDQYCLAENDSYSAVHIDLIKPATRHHLAGASPWKTVDGVEVRRTAVTMAPCRGMCVVAVASIAVPEADLIIWIESPDTDEIDAVLNSVQVVPDGYTTVPDISGEEGSQARSMIEDAGLISRDLPHCGPVDSCAHAGVAGSLPAAGSVVRTGSAVLGIRAATDSVATARRKQTSIELRVLTIEDCGWRVESAQAATASTLAVTVTYEEPDACAAARVPFRTTLKPSGVTIADVRKIALTLDGAGETNHLEVAVTS